jgi:predicted GNAT family acetyltransferase
MDSEDIENSVVNNEYARRFEFRDQDAVAFMNYFSAAGRIAYTHTEVPPQMEGRGIGSALARFAMHYAEANELKVIPTCPFLAGYLRRHPEYHHLIWEGYLGFA